MIAKWRFPSNLTWAGETRKENQMLWTIAIVLVILWILGFSTHIAIGGMAWLIHVLLVIAIVVVLIRVIQGRPAV
jgi:hypothetical protein